MIHLYLLSWHLIWSPHFRFVRILKKLSVVSYYFSINMLTHLCSLRAQQLYFTPYLIFHHILGLQLHLSSLITLNITWSHSLRHLKFSGILPLPPFPITKHIVSCRSHLASNTNCVSLENPPWTTRLSEFFLLYALVSLGTFVLKQLSQFISIWLLDNLFSILSPTKRQFPQGQRPWRFSKHSRNSIHILGWMSTLSF